MINAGTKLVDSMDIERIVVPVEEHGRLTTCRIYWHTNTGLVFGGKADIPSSLFEQNLTNERIGFLAAYNPADYVAKQREPEVETKKW